MVDYVYAGVGLIAGILVSAAFAIALGWSRKQRHLQRRSDAYRVLRQHGYMPCLYYPSVDVEDDALSNAMNAYALEGYVIKDRYAEIVGRAIPVSPCHETVALRRSRIRLVISNTRTAT